MKKLLPILLLTGCASYGKVLDNWVGAHIDRYVAYNGAPAAQSGNTYTFVRSGGTGATYVGGDFRTFRMETCQINLTVDDDGVIRGYSYRGDC